MDPASPEATDSNPRLGAPSDPPSVRSKNQTGKADIPRISSRKAGKLRWRGPLICFLGATTVAMLAVGCYLAYQRNCASLKLLGHTDRVYSTTFSPNGALLASSSSDKTVRLWKTKTGNPCLVLGGFSSRVVAVTFSPDGRFLACASDGDETERLSFGKLSSIEKLEAGTGKESKVRIYDIASEHFIADLHARDQVASLAFRRDGLLACGEITGLIELWDSKSWERRSMLAVGPHSITKLAFLPDGSRLVSAGEDGRLRLWSPDAIPNAGRCFQHSRGITGLALDSSGEVIATGCRDGTATLWDLKSGIGHVVYSCDGWITSVSLSPDGRLLATGELLRHPGVLAAPYGTAKIWDTARGCLLRELVGHTWGITSVDFSPDGKKLATGDGEGLIRIWRISPGIEEKERL